MGSDLVPLLSFAIVTTFTPGPNNISSAAMGVLYGYRNTLTYLMGISTGFFVMMVLAATLSNTLLALIPELERYLRGVGAAYILYLAYGTLRCTYAFSESEQPRLAFARGLCLQMVNPKVVVYGLTLYTTFMAPVVGRLDLCILSATGFAATAFAATSTWTLFGAAIRKHLKNEKLRRWINTVLCLLLIYTALSLSGILARFFGT